MEYQQFSPGAHLSQFVKCYWSLTNDAESAAKERIFPDGCIELIFNLGDRVRKHDSDEDSHIQPRSFIHGQITKFIEIEPTGEANIFGIRFQPGGLQRFIDFNVSDITDTTIEISEVWKTDSVSISRLMQTASDNDARIEVIENFLTKRMTESKRHDNDVEDCVLQLVESNGMLALDDLYAKFPIGQRQLERKFSAAVGLSPKMLARILRFQFVLQLIKNGKFTNFTKTAIDGGFYDQAHFIKDFKHFTGLNPKKYFSENLEMAKYFAELN